MKILHASPGFGKPMTENEVDDFLSKSVLQLHLGTLDRKGEPNIHPVWFYYDSTSGKIYFNTFRVSQKLSNIKNNSDKNIYFCVDEASFPYRGIRGKGIALTHHDTDFNLSIAVKIMKKYYGDTEHPNSIAMLEQVRSGGSIIVEITPKYFSTWDYSKG